MRIDNRPGPLSGELRVALGRMTRRVRSQRGEHDLPDNHYAVLAVLLDRGPLSPSALAERERVQPPHMTRIVNALAEAGFVTKGDHPTDRRGVLVELTPAGQAEVRETRRRRDAWLTRALASLEPAERQTLAEAAAFLRRLAEG